MSGCCGCDSFSTGRKVIGFISILIGIQAYAFGYATYDQNLNDLRDTFYPNSKSN